MRGISIKAMIAGNLLNLAFLFAQTWATAMVIVDMLRSRTLTYVGDFLAADAVVLVLVVIAVGYLAARISGRAFILNAALSATVLVLWNLLLLVQSAVPDTWWVNALTWASPLFAALGGYARARQAPAMDEPATQPNPGRSGKIAPEKIVIAPALRTDPAAHHLWQRPKPDSTEG
jgi:hypothetical protein